MAIGSKSKTWRINDQDYGRIVLDRMVARDLRGSLRAGKRVARDENRRIDVTRTSIGGSDRTETILPVVMIWNQIRAPTTVQRRRLHPNLKVRNLDAQLQDLEETAHLPSP